MKDKSWSSAAERPLPCEDDPAPVADTPPDPTRRTFLRAGSSVLLAAAGATGSGAAQAQGSAASDTGRAWTVHAGWALVSDPLKPGESAGSGLRLQRDAQLLIRDGVITAIRSQPFREGLPHLDLSRELVLPGFISGHTHCCSATPTRGIIETPRSYVRPLELVEELSDEAMDALTALNLAELLRSGCTTQVEMSLSLRQAESYVRVAERFGARGYPGAMIPGIERLFPIWFRDTDAVLAASEADTLDEIAKNLAFCRKYMGLGEGLIQPMMSPHACDTHTEKTLDALRAAVEELGTGLHIHLSQGARETATVRRIHGMTPAQWLEKTGLLQAGPVFGAHMSGLDWQVDPPILRRHGVVYAHCPSAGGAGNGTQPFPEALAAGVNVNIGIDTHSNDYLENLKLAVLYGQARHELRQEFGGSSGPATRRPTVQDAVDAATRVPARALGREDLGVLREGAQADLISVDVAGLLVGSGALPPEPLNNLLYANGRMVSTVMTRGRLQVREGAFIAAEVDPIRRAGGAAVEKIWRQLQSEDWFTPTPTPA